MPYVCVCVCQTVPPKETESSWPITPKAQVLQMLLISERKLLVGKVTTVTNLILIHHLITVRTVLKPVHSCYDCTLKAKGRVPRDSHRFIPPTSLGKAPMFGKLCQMCSAASTAWPPLRGTPPCMKPWATACCATHCKRWRRGDGLVFQFCAQVWPIAKLSELGGIKLTKTLALGLECWPCKRSPCGCVWKCSIYQPAQKCDIHRRKGD